MQVTICGPNLRDQSKGQFHAHAAGCNDLKKSRDPEYRNGWTIDAESQREVIEAVFGDFIFFTRHPWNTFTTEIHYFPCCNSLPMEVEVPFKQKDKAIDQVATELENNEALIDPFEAEISACLANLYQTLDRTSGVNTAAKRQVLQQQVLKLSKLTGVKF